MFRIIEKSSEIVEKAALYITIAYTVAVTLIVIVGVGFRYFGYALSWSEELARWLIIGIGFIGSSVVLKRGGHMGINAVLEKVPARIQSVFLFISYILILIFLCFTLWTGFISAVKSVKQTGAILPLPMFYLRIHIPIAALFMIIHILNGISGLIQRYDLKELYLSRLIIDEE